MMRLAVLCLLASFLGAAEVAVERPWSRATTGPNGAVFCQLTGGPDRLLSAEAANAERVELHGHVQEDGVWKMRQVPEIAVPAELKPRGLHIMLFGLRQPLREGDRVALTLRFATAGTVRVEVPVAAAGATAAP